MSSSNPLLPLEEARRRVLAGCRPLPAVRVPLGDALGAVLAETVVSAEAVPPFANTAMDGFAVRAADIAGATPDRPARLRIIGTLAAGQAPSQEVGAGQALRIMTGAPFPPGADTVAIVEVATVDGDDVLVASPSPAGMHVRPPGEDLSPGQEVFSTGDVLGPGHLGVLASIGRQEVCVRRRPVVGVLSTGDELVEGGAPLRPGQIRDSNRYTLLGLLRQSGFDAVDLGIARDVEDDIRAVISAGLDRCDALLTSGGVSMGDFDYVKKVLDELGDMSWMQVAIRPAKPLAFGVVDGRPVFGLPGNPVSSMVSFELFARPGLRRLSGFPDRLLERPRLRAIADDGLRRRPDGKLHLVRVVADVDGDGRYHVRSSGGQSSNLLRAMALANALALVPDGGGVEAGGEVDILVLG